jgi:hypothetical protein
MTSLHPVAVAQPSSRQKYREDLEHDARGNGGAQLEDAAEG